MARKRVGFLLLVLIIACGSVFHFPSVANAAETVSSISVADGVSAALAELLQVLEQYYPGDIMYDAVMEAVLKSATEGLGDPYTGYMTNQEVKEYLDSLDGRYGGIGVVVTKTSQGLLITEVLQNSPAEEAGLRKGQIIKRVDGVPVDNLGQEFASAIRGPEGTVVSLEVITDLTGVSTDIQVRRRAIVTQPMQVSAYPGGIFYIKVTRFSNEVGINFPVILQVLRDHGMTGLILDLRDNPGGTLNSAIDVAKVLVPNGSIVRIESKNQSIVISSDERFQPIPTAVLVNSNTASAAEIVTAAIQDNHVGVVIGSKTFGKGCIQTLIPLRLAPGVLKLTVGYYFSPSGKAIHGVGVKPNVELSSVPRELPVRPCISRNLRNGDQGTDALDVEKLLQYLGLLDASEVDGIVNERTCEAVAQDLGAAFGPEISPENIWVLFQKALDKWASSDDQALNTAVTLLTTREMPAISGR